MALSNKNRGEKFIKHLSNIFIPHLNYDPLHRAKVKEFFSLLISLSLPPKAVNLSKIKFIINELNPENPLGMISHFTFLQYIS